jgi:hypothetical protein
MAKRDYLTSYASNALRRGKRLAYGSGAVLRRHSIPPRLAKSQVTPRTQPSPAEAAVNFPTHSPQIPTTRDYPRTFTQVTGY